MCLAVCLLTLFSCSSKKDPLSITVLYVGEQSEWANGEYGEPKKFATQAEFKQSIAERMEAFGTLLRTYFNSVCVMPAAGYRPELSQRVKLSCQTCDAHVCMPPLEKSFTLKANN